MNCFYSTVNLEAWQFTRHDKDMIRNAMPVYAQIAEELRRNIQQGTYQVGDRLPTELELAERFEVNRHTLRQAIALLKQEGLLRVDQGRGTFVSAAPIRYAVGKRVRYNDALKAEGLKPSSHLLRVVQVPADDAIAKALELPIGEAVALVERLSLADEQPISVAASYFPLRLFPDLLQPARIQQLNELRSISKFLRQGYGCDHLRRQTQVSARLVKPQDARLLEVPLNHAILLAESINVDQQGRVIEYGVTRFRGDRMELVFENDLQEHLWHQVSPH